MAFCRYCGHSMGDGDAVCSSCGAPVAQPVMQPVMVQQPVMQEPDNGGIGWGLLGFFIPLVGLILFLVWNTSRPRTAKALGIGALVSVIVGVVLVVLFYALFFGLLFQAVESGLWY